MKTKITLLSLMLLFTVFGIAQQVNPVYKNRKLNEENNHSFDTNYKRFDVNNPFLTSQNSSSARLKTATNNMQKLDSLIHYKWDTNINQWKNYSKYEFTYNANGKVTNSTSSYWINSNHWEYSTKVDYSYDSNGYIATSIGCLWDYNTNQWKNNYKNEYQYDNNGNLILLISNFWDVSTNQWINQYKTEYSLDSNGNTILNERYRKNNTTNQWTLYSKTEFTYDVNENNVLSISYEWNTGLNQWINYGKHENSYDNNGNLIQEKIFNWDSNTNQWIKYSKNEYTYDINGNKTSYIWSNWDNNTNQWMYYLKYDYIYDTNGNRISYIRSNWDTNTNQWINPVKNELTHDISINVSNLIIPYTLIFNYQLRNKLLERNIYIWNTSNNNWETIDKEIFYYSDTNAIDELSDNNIQLYPNPVSSNLNINFENHSGPAVFEVFDMQGHKLLSRKVYKKDQINLNGLSSGVYLYTIMIDGGKKSGKLIKK